MCVTFNSTYKGSPINTNKDKDFGCYTEILDTYKEILDETLSKHSQVIQVRFDLRYPKNRSIDPDPAHIHKFNYNLKKKLNRITNKDNHFVDARLMSVQEQDEERGTVSPNKSRTDKVGP